MSNIKSSQRFWNAFLGEERPRDMLVLLAIFVTLAHIWILLGMMRNEEPVTQAVPLVMEVSMVSIAAPKPAVTPPKPEPTPPPPKKPQIKKTPKPVKKPRQVVQKAPDFAPVEKVEPPPAQETSATNSSPSNQTSAQTKTTATETFTEANYKANYAHNPKPHYPPVAKRRGWQGKVLLRVKVSAQGLSDTVSVERSSGHEMLDDAAVEAVKKWRFIPAKRGQTPVASSVIVPIVFTLRN